jgi:hypothetical protein
MLRTYLHTAFHIFHVFPSCLAVLLPLMRLHALRLIE